MSEMNRVEVASAEQVERGLLVVISGPSASGKGTVNRYVLENEDFVYSVSATTRQPRVGEVDGVNYHFTTKENFERLIAENEVLEYTRYCENYYGTLRSFVEERRLAGKHVVLEIEDNVAPVVGSNLMPSLAADLLTLLNGSSVVSGKTDRRNSEPCKKVDHVRAEVAKNAGSRLCLIESPLEAAALPECGILNTGYVNVDKITDRSLGSKILKETESCLMAP